MTGDQLELLEVPGFLRPAIARRSDPITSKRAAVIADATTRTPDKIKLRDLVRELPGLTSSEYAKVLRSRGMDETRAQRMPSRRMSDLLKDGTVIAGEPRTCTVTGAIARTHFPGKRRPIQTD